MLSICAVVVAILLSLLVFLVCMIVDTVKDGKDNVNQNNGQQSNHDTVDDIVYVSMTQQSSSIHSGSLIVVSEKLNYQYQYPSTVLKDFKDSDLHIMQNGSRPYTYSYLKENERMEKNAAYAVDKMLTDFYLKCEDSSLIFMDAYRTQEEQDSKLTPVSFSEHETGYVFTLHTYNSSHQKTNLTANANYNWIYENCKEYGIIRRYPESKSTITGVSGYEYCFRYVGVAHATYMYEKSLCLEEYVELLKTTYTVNNHLKIAGADGKNYAVYYVPVATTELTQLQVPKNYEYTISGDNIGGFIVTVCLDAPVSA